MSLNPKSFYSSWLHTEHDPDGPGPDAGTRWRVLKLVVVLLFALLAARLWQLQVLQNERYSRVASANSVRRLPIEAQRGVVYDRDGEQLATNTPLWRVSLMRSDMPEDEAAYQAAFLRLERRLRLGGVAFVDASVLPPNGSDAEAREAAERLGVPVREVRRAIVAKTARVVGVPEDAVRRAVAESVRSGASVLLREDLSVQQASRLRAALREVPGADAMLRTQWLVEYGGQSPFRPAVVADNVPREQALAIEGERLLIPGVSIEQVAARSYADGERYAHVMGYVGRIGAEQVAPLQAQARKLGQRRYALDETVGKAGLEGELEGYLRGTPGAQEVEVTSSNRVVRQGKLRDATPGNNVTLTLDGDVQAAGARALSEAMERSGARSGAVVALDPRNGQVLSLVSLPSYDNNRFVQGLSSKEYAALLNDPGKPLLNKAVSGQYTPGAVLKPFVAAGGLAERVIDERLRYPCLGKIEVPSPSGSLQRDVYWGSPPRRLGPRTVTQALANGCDEFFYILAGPAQRDRSGRELRYYLPGEEDPIPFRGLGIERINRYLRNFGFGEPTGIGLPGEADGLVADGAWKAVQFPGQPWTLGDTLLTAVGQGYTLATPLQMAAATAAVANGGAVYEPRLVLKVTDPRGKTVLQPEPEQVGTAGMTPDHLATVREGMRLAVEVGMAKGLRQPGVLPRGVRVGAMSGTVDRTQKDLQPPAPAWFTAFAPYEKPEIVVAVLLDGGEGDADHASPVGAAVLRAYFRGER